MTGYNGFIYTQELVDFFGKYQQAISETLEQLACDSSLIVSMIEDEELTTNEYACAMFTSLFEE